MGLFKPSLFFISLFLAVFSCVALAETDHQPDSDILWNSNTLDKNFTALPTLLPGYFYEHQIVSHLASQLQTCITQTPSGHGLLFHIEDLIKEPSNNDVSNEGQRLVKRGMIADVRKGWNAMPFDQRLSVITTAAGTASVPMFLMSSGVAFNEMEIGNFKDRLLNRPTSTDNKTTHHRSSTFTMPLPPPPPPPSPSYSIPIKTSHRKRGWADSAQGLVNLVRRSTSMEKKVPNEKVGRILGMAGAANALLYLSSGAIAAARVFAVRDGDTSAYKRSMPEEMSGFTVTCLPVEKLNDNDYQIPQAALNNVGQENKDTELPSNNRRMLTKRSVIPVHEEDHAKMKDMTEEPFVRRTTGANKGSGSHPPGPEGHAPPGGPHPEGEGPIEVEQIKHIYHIDASQVGRGREGGLSKKKSSSSKTKTAMLLGLGAGTGYLAHSFYAGQQQQQQVVPYPYVDDQGYPIRVAKRDEQFEPSFLVKRGEEDDDSDLLLSKRSPTEPVIRTIKKEYHWNNVHPDDIPGSHSNNRQTPAESQGENPSKDTEKKKKMSMTTQALLVGGGALGGALLHAYTSSSNAPIPPPPQQMMMPPQYYGDESAGYYQKREMTSKLAEQHQLPILKSGMDGSTIYSPSYLAEKIDVAAVKRSDSSQLTFNNGPSYLIAPHSPNPSYLDASHLVKRQVVQQKRDESYDAFLRSLKAEIEKEEKKHQAVSVKVQKRDNIHYDTYGGDEVEFSADWQAKDKGASAASKKSTKEEDAVDALLQHKTEQNLQRRDSTVQFDTDKDQETHFKASLNSSAVGKSGPTNVDDMEEEEEDKLVRREIPASITYEENSQGQHFAATPSSDHRYEDEGAEMRRRDDSTIVYDHNANGSHFEATHPSGNKVHKSEQGHTASSATTTTDDDEDDDNPLTRRNHDQKNDNDNDTTAKIDYTANKDNEVTFHASTPAYHHNNEPASDMKVDAHYEKQDGVTIRISPRDDLTESTSSMIKRNKFTADR